MNKEELIKREFDNLRLSMNITNGALLSLITERLGIDKKEAEVQFADLFEKEHNRITGVDFKTNVSIGTLVVTKYNRDGKTQQWKLGQKEPTVKTQQEHESEAGSEPV